MHDSLTQYHVGKRTATIKMSTIKQTWCNACDKIRIN
jgi:hypothetical protein